jgi:hypothetical protein
VGNTKVKRKKHHNERLPLNIAQNWCGNINVSQIKIDRKTQNDPKRSSAIGCKDHPRVIQKLFNCETVFALSLGLPIRSS